MAGTRDKRRTMGLELCEAASVALPGNTHPVPTMLPLVCGVSTPPPHQDQFGLSYQPQLDIPPGKGAGMELGPTSHYSHLSAGKGEKSATETQETFSNSASLPVPHSSPLLRVAASSLRKLFPLDNITGVSLPVPGGSLCPGCSVFPWGLHTHEHPVVPNQGFALPHLLQVLLLHMVCIAALLERYMYTQILTGSGLGGDSVGKTVGPVLLPCSPRSMVHSAYHLLPLDMGE